MAKTFHVLLTRFNVRRAAVPDPRALSHDWLAQRMAIFAQVTVPSVVAQRCPPDLWLVFLDELTPAPARLALARLAEQHGFLRPVYCGVLGDAVYRAVIAQAVPAGTDWLLSTRLDNDDALHPALLAAVRAAVQVGRREFINPVQGLVVGDGLLYRKSDKSSPFISLSEPLQGFQTVWLDQHQRLGRHGPVRQLPLRDAWMQFVHGGNIANQVRGVRVRPQQVDAGIFPPGLRVALKPVSWLSFGLDNTVGLLRRYAGSLQRRLRREWADRRAR